MATVTYNQAGTSGAFKAVAGTIGGFIEGEKFNEGKRQFNETLGLEKDKFKENQVQWDEDMEYRFTNLRQMAEDNRLNRAQADKFNSMADIRAREMQRAGFDFQEYFTKKIEQPFAAEQNEADRKVTRRGQSLQYAEGMDSNLKQYRASMTALEEQKRQHQSDSGTAITIGTEILGDLAYMSMPPEQQAAALQRATEKYIGLGRVRGSEGVTQTTAEEYSAAEDHMRDVLLNLPARKATYVDEQMKMASIQSGLRNGIQVSTTGSGQMSFLPATPSWNAAGFGVPDRDPNAMTPNDNQLHGEMLAKLAEIRVKHKTEGWDQYGADLQMNMARPELTGIIGQMHDKSPYVQEYYDKMLQAVIYPESGGIESLQVE